MPTFCPVLKIKVGTLKPLILLGLRTFCPFSHFFLSFNAIKKIKKIIIISEKKWATGQKDKKRPYIVLTRAVKRSTISTAQNVRFILTKVEKRMVDIWEKLIGDQDNEILDEESYEPADDLESEDM